MSDATTTDASEHLEKIDHAMSVFAATPPVETHANILATAKAAGSDDPYSSGVGLMKFVFNDKQIASDPEVVKRVEDAKYYLKGMMSLVTAKIFGDNKDNINASFVMPPSDVKEVAVHLPLLSAFEAKEASNSESTTVVEFSKDLMTIVLDLALDDYPGAVEGVTKWLQSTGDQIKSSVEVTKPNYDVTIFSGVISVTKVGGVIDIEPAFQIAGASLAVADIKASLLGCVKTEHFTLNYTAPYFRAPFNFDVLEQNETVRKKMEGLITKGSVDQIENSKGYFGV